MSLHCDPFRLNYSTAKFGISTGMSLNRTLFESKPFIPKPVLMPNSAIVDDEMD